MPKLLYEDQTLLWLGKKKSRCFSIARENVNLNWKKFYCIKLQELEPLIPELTSNDSTVSAVVWPGHKIGNKAENWNWWSPGKN